MQLYDTIADRREHVMIPRGIAEILHQRTKTFPIVSLTGPRQSGKTTLVKTLFAEKYRYVTLENLDTRQFAKEDPRGFLRKYDKFVIFDEVQRVPELFSYLQGIVDDDQIPGQFILTGSQHFLLMKKITQSLAGRVAVLHLLPLQISELQEVNSLEDTIFKGFYPRLQSKNIFAPHWHESYIQTYVERDVRSLQNIHDLDVFQMFMKMCASRTGQLLNLTSLGNDCGISHNTAKEWINILYTSFILFKLQPYYKNFNKRLVKSPKLFFYDTGLLCNLLGIENQDQLVSHALKGHIFENFIISDILKQFYNKGQKPKMYFWRDKTGNEIDCIIEKGLELFPIEIKSAETIHSDFFSGLKYWGKLTQSDKNGILVYGGNESYVRSNINVVNWENIGESILKTCI